MSRHKLWKYCTQGGVIFSSMTANGRGVSGSNPAMLPKKYKIVLSGGTGAPHGNIKFNQKPIKLLNASFMDVYQVKKIFTFEQWEWDGYGVKTS